MGLGGIGEFQVYFKILFLDSHSKEANEKLKSSQRLNGPEGALKEMIQRILHTALEIEMNDHVSKELGKPQNQVTKC